MLAKLLNYPSALVSRNSTGPVWEDLRRDKILLLSTSGTPGNNFLFGRSLLPFRHSK
jgi:hypothetical protein